MLRINDRKSTKANKNVELAIPPLFWPVNCIRVARLLHFWRQTFNNALCFLLYLPFVFFVYLTTVMKIWLQKCSDLATLNCIKIGGHVALLSDPTVYSLYCVINDPNKCEQTSFWTTLTYDQAFIFLVWIKAWYKCNQKGRGFIGYLKDRNRHIKLVN